MTRPRDRLLAALPDEARPRFERADLDARLEALAGEVRAELGLPLDAGAVADALAPRVEPSSSLEAELAALSVVDLVLAARCAAGDEAALRAFDRRHGADLDVAVAKSPGLGVGKEEFRQLFRERMFVADPPGSPPRIAGYGGRGALRAWVRVAAARLVIDLSRAKRTPEPTPDDALLSLLPPTAEPEHAYLRGAYAALLPGAFGEALASLSPRQRNLLRQRYLHGLPGDKLARMYGVHRGTLFAWLEAARRALLEAVAARMRARVPAHDLDSIVALLGSRLDVSVERMLARELEPEG